MTKFCARRFHKCVREFGMLDDSAIHDVVVSIPENAEVLAVLDELRLPDCYLTAGCLFQPIWNRKTRKPDLWGVKDFDVFYFDNDTSWEAENEIIQRAIKPLGSLAKRVEIRNQARVHLWYEQKFGSSITPLMRSTDGIDRFLISCTCIGIEVSSRELYAPNGLKELYDGELKMNPINPKPNLFQKKALDYQSRWPWLVIAD